MGHDLSLQRTESEGLRVRVRFEYRNFTVTSSTAARAATHTTWRGRGQWQRCSLARVGVETRSVSIDDGFSSLHE